MAMAMAMRVEEGGKSACSVKWQRLWTEVMIPFYIAYAVRPATRG